jgi:nucleoside-diphosphate kinase
VSNTFFMIKPDAVASAHVGAILAMAERDGFKIVAQKMMRVPRDAAALFYLEHKARPFYNSLVDFMSSGPVVACILSHDDAVLALRRLIGDTDPVKASEGTVRKAFGRSIESNAVHASDSETSAAREMGFFFAQAEIFV